MPLDNLPENHSPREIIKVINLWYNITRHIEKERNQNLIVNYKWLGNLKDRKFKLRFCYMLTDSDERLENSKDRKNKCKFVQYFFRKNT